MKTLITFSLGFLSLCSFGQLTWSDGAAELFYENCTVCHNSNGIAPFELMSYDDVSPLIGAITDAVESEYMPPWTADDDYQSYAHSRSLSAVEKTALLSWLSDGAPEGDPQLAPPAPVYNNVGFIQAEADLELEMPEHTSNATNFQDDYICVAIPTGLTEDKKIRAFEVIPGNPSILHHCLVYIDETGNSTSDYSGVCGGPNNDVGLIGGFAPGAFPTIFPSDGEDLNLGITLPAGSNIILALHYPHGSEGEVDQSKVKIYFYDDEVEIREINTHPLLENWGFSVPANTQQEVNAQFNGIFTDYSIFSVFPHMHLVGEYIQAYAIDPDDEVIPLIKIPHWDFEWQEFYFFDHLQKIPSGSTLYANGTYNNTSDNPHNPNDPPQTITAGLNTTDEMFLVYFHYLPYVEGDELLDLEELTLLSTDLTEVELNQSDLFSVYPNPSDEEFTFSFSLENASNASLYIYDVNGKVVDKVLANQQINGSEKVTWNASTIDAGVYYYSLMLNGIPHSGKVLVE